MPAETVDELIPTLPRNEQLIVKRLRAMVKECLPKAQENITFGVPFYRHHRLICFIWPPSVNWGPVDKRGEAATKGVTLGFNYGNHMSNDQGVLLAEGRKQVYVMYFKNLSDIDDTVVRAELFEAGMLDDNFGEKKKKKGSRRGR